jgi:hypothetical protein
MHSNVICRNIVGKLNLRREISRCAARDRRSLETNVLNELLEEIPLVTEPKVTLIDRIAQLRLAATFVRLRGCVPKCEFIKADFILL